MARLPLPHQKKIGISDQSWLDWGLIGTLTVSDCPGIAQRLGLVPEVAELQCILKWATTFEESEPAQGSEAALFPVQLSHLGMV